jgi:tetratricopeptide (TPR) repeat protein
MLFVLDDARSDKQLDQVLSSIGDGNSVLVTGQQEFKLLATRYRIVPIFIGGLPSEAAVRVLVELLHLSALGPDEVSYLTAVSTSFGNHPLALEIIAPELSERGFDGVMLSNEQRTSAQKSSFSTPDLDRLRAAVLDGVAQVGEEYQDSFAALGLFEGTSTDWDAILHVCGLARSGKGERFIRQLQLRGILKSLSHRRVSIHDFVRTTARLSFAGLESTRPEVAHRLLRNYLTYYSERVQLDGGYEWNLGRFPRLIADEWEVFSAIEKAADHWLLRGDDYAGRQCIEMTLQVSWYLHWRGYWDMRSRLCKRITDAAESGRYPQLFAGSKLGVGNLYVDRGWVSLHQHDLATAQTCATAGAKWLQGSGDDIFAQELSAQVDFMRGDFAAALEKFELLRSNVRPDTRVWFVFSLRLVDTLLAQGSEERADEILSEIARRVGHADLIGNEIIEDVAAKILYRRALRHISKNDKLAAIAALEDAVEKFSKAESVDPTRAAVLIELSRLQRELGSSRAALAHAQSALVQARAVGDQELIDESERLLMATE